MPGQTGVPRVAPTAAPPAPTAGQQPTMRDYIGQEAEKLGIPASLALSMVHQESRNEGMAATSKKGARGFFQLMPATAAELGVNPDDPFDNIRGGLTYFKQQLDAHKGDFRLALAAYNAGPARIKEGRVPDIPETQDYVQKILTMWEAGGPPSAAGQLTAAPPPALPAAAVLPGALPQDRIDAAVRAPGAEEEPGFLASLASSYDPTTFEGRVNLGATVAATVAGVGAAALTKNPQAAAATGAAVRAGVSPWLLRVLGPPAAAAVAGGGIAATESTLGTAPEGTDPLTTGAWQGAYELGGHATMWPIRRLGRGLLATRVGRYASEALSGQLQQSQAVGRDAIAAVRTQVRAGIDAAKSAAASTMSTLKSTQRAAARDVGRATELGVETATAVGRQQTRAARQQAASLLADTELATADELASITKQYDNLLAQPASTTAAGQLTRDVLQGPSKRALDLAGQKVNESTVGGPAIQLTPIKDSLAAMIAKARPASLFSAVDAGPGASAIGFTVGAGTRQALAAQAGVPGDQLTTPMIARMLGVSEAHPLPGILGQLQQAPEQLTFKDAHQLKRLLDEAVNWDVVAKKHLQGITKSLRGTLREALAVHEPYNTATSVYETTVKLWRQGVGKRVVKAATENPDAIAKTLKPDNPAQAAVIKNLLLTQAERGGGGQAGQEAWDSVRASFIHDKVIKGGIDGLETRARALVEQNPEFSKIVLDDLSGQRIISNLAEIGASYRRIVEQATGRTAAATTAGKTTIETAKAEAKTVVQHARQRGAGVRRAAQEARTVARESLATQQGAALTTAQRAGQAATATVTREARLRNDAIRAQLKSLRESSLKSHSITGQLGDFLRAAMLGPKGSLWGTLSLVRLLNGPNGDEMVRWAAYSPTMTRLMVQVLEGTLNDRGWATLYRSAASAFDVPEGAADLFSPAARDLPVAAGVD